MPTQKMRDSRFAHSILNALVAVMIGVVALAGRSPAASGLDLLVEDAEASGVALAKGDVVSPIVLDSGDFAGVLRAAADLESDIGKVFGKRPERVVDQLPEAPVMLVVGTLGRHRLIDRLAASGKLEAGRIAGNWESFMISTIRDPGPGIPQAVVVAGSDKRGTIYGIYEISEQIGVSPWHWWADVPVRRRELISIREGSHVQGPPAVKYRGIFINDEEPAFGSWAREKFGGINSKMYGHVFELILRLRGNYLWPAMWGKAFNEDDPLNPKLADEYGIVMGTSHHEPMMRAQQEWTKRKDGIGNGQWNYHTNRKGLQEFWSEGIERNADYENLITIGMRGDGDEPMVEGGDMRANIRLLEEIVADQREIIARHVDRDVTRVPQVWALYKEVSDYYDHGMRVPDDVTLLWCDDNWGNLRRLPTAAERDRPGGAGIYYHFDYVGGPRSYRWINTNPLPKIWEQMNLAHAYGADRIWIVNVGDLKPMEIPTEFFLRMAWDPASMTRERLSSFTRDWAKREFGDRHAEEIAEIVSRYAKYNGWRKPELLEPDTFSPVHYDEARRVREGWQEIVSRAERIHGELPEEYRDVFYQLVLYPTKASATVANLYIEVGLNRLCAEQGRASTNDHAARAERLFERDQQLSDEFHSIRGGKWNHMMAQTRIGYRSWNEPRRNLMPRVVRVAVPPGAAMGLAVEGSRKSWPGADGDPELPPFDSRGRQVREIEVFRRGSDAFPFVARADRAWVRLDPPSGQVDDDLRIQVSIDWDKVPEGEHSAVVTVSRPGGEQVPVRVRAVRSEQWADAKAYGNLTGPVAIAAEDAAANHAAGGVRWEVIPDYGRGKSGMSVFPVTAASVSPPRNSPRLEYPVLIPVAGDIEVELVTGPSLNFDPSRGVRLAVSFGDGSPRVLDAFSDQEVANPHPSAPAIRDWATWVRDNARSLRFRHRIDTPGIHTLKVWMVDPGVVLEKIVVRRGDEKPSYFGPPVEPPLASP